MHSLQKRIMGRPARDLAGEQTERGVGGGDLDRGWTEKLPKKERATMDWGRSGKRGRDLYRETLILNGKGVQGFADTGKRQK